MPAVLGVVLAVPILMLVMLGVLEWVDNRVRESLEVGSARKLVVLAGAVERHVQANYGAVVSGPIALGTLEGEELIPDGFGDGDAMKRGLRVHVLRNADRLRVVTMQEVEDGDDRWPGSGIFEARGRQSLGVVDAAGVLRGPTINENLAAFRTAAGGHPRQWALAVYQEFDRESVCGDFLYRRVRAGCPDAAVMETDLDLDGNDIEGVRRLEVETLEASDSLVVGGDFRIGGEFSVGRALRVQGSFSVPGAVTFQGDAEFTGRVDANEAAVTGLLEAGSVEAGGSVTAANMEARGNVTASGATLSSINAASGRIRTLTVGRCTGC